MTIFYDSKNPIFNSRDPILVPKRLKKPALNHYLGILYLPHEYKVQVIMFDYRQNSPSMHSPHEVKQALPHTLYTA